MYQSPAAASDSAGRLRGSDQVHLLPCRMCVTTVWLPKLSWRALKLANVAFPGLLSGLRVTERNQAGRLRPRYKLELVEC